MFKQLNTKLLPFLLGLALAGCATLASTGDGCTLADLSDDELWELEPESLSTQAVIGVPLELVPFIALRRSESEILSF